MHKYSTHLTFFKYRNPILVKDIVSMTWFYLEPEVNGATLSRCFTYAELQLFSNFVVGNQINFPGNKNYFSCSGDETPNCDSVMPKLNAIYPSNFILRKPPTLSRAGLIYDCMDIILMDSYGNNNHTYNLEFDVIGRLAT